MSEHSQAQHRLRRTSMALFEDQLFRLQEEALRRSFSRGRGRADTGDILREIIDVHFAALDKNKVRGKARK